MYSPTSIFGRVHYQFWDVKTRKLKLLHLLSLYGCAGCFGSTLIHVAKANHHSSNRIRIIQNVTCLQIMLLVLNPKKGKETRLTNMRSVSIFTTFGQTLFLGIYIFIYILQDVVDHSYCQFYLYPSYRTSEESTRKRRKNGKFILIYFL